jgi:hypothetical protein
MTGLSVADRWFEITRISDDITLLIEPHVVPLMRCNIWHVRGRDRDLLIDTGMGIASLREAARHLLEKAVTAVATHTRVDQGIDGIKGSLPFSLSKQDATLFRRISEKGKRPCAGIDRQGVGGESPLR